MNYREANLRLREIKKEIYEFRHLPVIDIQEKIQNLKNINLLLREQNRLLLIRQQIMNARRDSAFSSTENTHFLSTEYDSERVA